MVVTDLVAPDILPEDSAMAANKVIALQDRRDLLGLLNPASDLTSLLLDEEMLTHLQRNEVTEFLALREAALHQYLTDFLDVRTAWRHEDTPPLEDLIIPMVPKETAP